MDSHIFVDQLSTMSLEERTELLNIFNISFDEIISAAAEFTELSDSFPALYASEIIMNVFPPMILVLGTVGNIISFIALSSLKNKGTANVFLRMLAVLDTNVLWFGLFPDWLDSLFHFDVKTQSDFLCKFITFITYTSSISSVWNLVVLTTERYIAVYQPLRVSIIFNNRRLPYLIGVPIGLTILLNVHFLGSVGVISANGNDTFSQCSSTMSFVDDIWPWVDALVYSTIPCCLLIFLNVMIVRKMFVVQNKSKQVYLRRTKSNASKNTCKTTVICVTISVFCLMTILPMNVMLLLTMFWNQGSLGTLEPTGEEAANMMLAVDVSSLLMYTNHAMNFFLYLFVGSKFRKHVWRILRSKRRFWYNMARLATHGSSVDLVSVTRRYSLSSNRRDSLSPISSRVTRLI